MPYGGIQATYNPTVNLKTVCHYDEPGLPWLALHVVNEDRSRVVADLRFDSLADFDELIIELLVLRSQHAPNTVATVR